MLLRRLAEYCDRLEARPSLYAETPVRYIFDLDASGVLVNERPQDTANLARPRMRRGEPRLMPQIQRAKAIKPILFASNAEYTFGLARKTSSRSRVEQCHKSYLMMLRECVEATGLDEVRA